MRIPLHINLIVYQFQIGTKWNVKKVEVEWNLRGNLLKAEGLCFLEELYKDIYGSRLAGLYTKRNYLFN